MAICTEYQHPDYHTSEAHAIEKKRIVVYCQDIRSVDTAQDYKDTSEYFGEITKDFYLCLLYISVSLVPRSMTSKARTYHFQ
jgi:hypothetical protein